MADEPKPATAFDVSDERLAVELLRIVQREVKTGFEMVLLKIEQFAQKLEGHDDRISDLERSHLDHARRIAALEQSATRRRVAVGKK
jgi:hypothetical protein